MDRDKDNFRTVSRLEIVGTGRRRRFTDEAKLRIVEEGFSGDGRQVSATALKHDVSRSQLYRWRQLLREGRLGGVRVEGFVPAVITPDDPTRMSAPLNRVAAGGGLMEVVSANGRRVIVDRDVDVDALLRILRGLETLR
ncbi:IS66-like element accessory protein TnpA [Manganibacter manganicus]|uniref:Transposase n=1 Tax=Manganibacter manganicus TaxID=1873176 RepID=A0A1V8RN48_9HYPH|nr:transposase [Pseudaminobacter manganicus]OQM74608.1 hypothetical protein BFN67_21225 [Pseudaminobacter manganicus]